MSSKNDDSNSTPYFPSQDSNTGRMESSENAQRLRNLMRRSEELRRSGINFKADAYTQRRSNTAEPNCFKTTTSMLCLKPAKGWLNGYGICRDYRPMGLHSSIASFRLSDQLWLLIVFKLRLRNLSTKSFASLLKGCFAAVRNPLAHEPKILWQGEDDAADYFSLIPPLHRKLDDCVRTGLGGY